jgi:hypothetical protein
VFTYCILKIFFFKKKKKKKKKGVTINFSQRTKEERNDNMEFGKRGIHQIFKILPYTMHCFKSWEYSSNKVLPL